MDTIDISDFDKNQLADYAKTEFGVDLDLRKSLDNLKKEVDLLQGKRNSPAVVVEEVNAPGKATHLLNRDTGKWFPYTKLLAAYLPNAVPCDENGQPV